MLNGSKIILRPLQAGDIENTMLWRNNPAIREAAMTHPFPVTRELEKNWFDQTLNNRSNDSIYFAIATKDEDEFVGYLFLNRINWISRICYFSIYIGEVNNQGKGYGTEALNLILNYAFSILNLRKVLLEGNADNIPAITLYQRTGFIQEGELKNHFFSHGKYINVMIMAIFSK